MATAFCRMFQTSIHSFSGTLSTRLLFVVQLLLSHIQLSHPMDCMGCSILGFPVLHHLLEPAQIISIELVMPSNHLVLCYPLLLLPSVFPSIRVFTNELALHIRCPKYWSFSLSISLSNEYSGLITLGFTGLISLKFKCLSRVFSNSTVQSINSSALRFLYGPALTSIHGQLGKKR